MRSLRSGRLVAFLGVGLLHGGCIVGSALEATRNEPTGKVHLASATLGEHDLVPRACASGERQVFLGADFLDDGAITTRLIVEPTGAASLRFFPAAKPLEAGVLFSRADCNRFEMSLEHTGWKVNEIYDLSVRIDFDCRNAAGDGASGSLVAEHCH
jgi:hypothetical protein